MMLAVIFALALLTIAMTVAVPAVKKSIQRDRELETMHRGEQYVRAIRLYYRKFGTYPASIDALVDTNGIRFLRQRYLDPTTGQDDWKPILLGQNKTPLAVGFFGQPLGITGVPLTGIASGAGNGVGGLPPVASGAGSNLNGGSLFNSGSNNSSDVGATGSTGSGSNSNSSALSSNSGTLFGGGPIMGVSPASPKQSILVYKKMDHYIDWEFLYSPLTDQMIGNNQIARPPLQGGAPGAPFASPSSPAPNSTPAQ
ncbi:MAG: type II secretion system protein [Terracidiphilus sp.]|nr:type II secretion system protein [Terracidiphilus sp.]MDR3776641.1 type II secretion system protein [Terracidiphilus sp.]